MIQTKRTSRGFTLVELLVVIGIIGALIAILLPVLSGVQARGRDIKCQSNLRQIVQALIGYAAENNGSFPYGFYWNRSINHLHPNGNPNPYDQVNTWHEAGDNDGSSGDPDNHRPFISWASQVGKYMGKRLNGDNDDTNFPPVLRCPEADQVYNHVVSYVMNFIVAISPENEFDPAVGGSGNTNAQIKPAKTSLFLKEGTALIWDTAIQGNWDNNVGFLTGADVDSQRFWRGANTPQFRYFSSHDPFDQFPPGTNGNNKPVAMGANWKNIDPGAPPTAHFPYQGNLRFRHNKGLVCNVGFSDGHVGQFTAKIKSDRTMLSHDAIRKSFMIKWPTGVAPNPGSPF